MIEHIVVVVLFVIVVICALCTPRLRRLIKERDEFEIVYHNAHEAHRWLSEFDSELEPMWQYVFATTYEKTFPKREAKTEGGFSCDEITLTLYHVASIDEAREKIRDARKEAQFKKNIRAMSVGGDAVMLAFDRPTFERRVANHFFLMLEDGKLDVDKSAVLASHLRTEINRENLALWHKEHNCVEVKQ